jgi:hypothetical protein
MTIHVIIPCSKSKTQAPSEDLVWNEKTTLEKWSLAWSDPDLKRFHPTELYTGRATQKQLQIVAENPDTIAYIISAGAGLLRVSDEIKMPPYESTFGRWGPRVEDLNRLPHGGISNLELVEGDIVVAFAPNSYLRAISKDPDLPRISDHLVAPKKSCLGDSCQVPVRIHPRIKEVLGVASADQNTELIRLFLKGGVSAIESVSDKAEDLPALPERSKVSDEELFEIVKEHSEGKTAMELVRFIRDKLNISASVERIREASNRDSV